MAKTKNNFSWVREDQNAEPREPADRRDSHYERAEKQALKALAWRLVALEASDRERLRLDPELLSEIAILARQGPKPSRRRHLLRVQKLLRAVDREKLETEFTRLETPAEAMPAVKRKVKRLLKGGDEAIHRFLIHNPTANRQQLRTLTRKAQGEGPAADRARDQLSVVIAKLMIPGA